MSRAIRMLAAATIAAVLAGCDASPPSRADTQPPSAATEDPTPNTAAGSETASAIDDADALNDPAPDGAPAEQNGDSSPQPAAESRSASNSARGEASDEVIDVTFDDLKCNMQPDVVFRPWMLTDRVKELDGRRIRIQGYMLPDLRQTGITEFILLRNTQCKFGPGGQADHLIRVKLREGVTTSYRGERPIEVVGRLKLNPFTGPDGNTWSLFDMEGESVDVARR